MNNFRRLMYLVFIVLALGLAGSSYNNLHPGCWLSVLVGLTLAWWIDWRLERR